MHKCINELSTRIASTQAHTQAHAQAHINTQGHKHSTQEQHLLDVPWVAPSRVRTLAVLCSSSDAPTTRMKLYCHSRGTRYSVSQRPEEDTLEVKGCRGRNGCMRHAALGCVRHAYLCHASVADLLHQGSTLVHVHVSRVAGKMEPSRHLLSIASKLRVDRDHECLARREPERPFSCRFGAISS